ncbi:MAG: serine--tRNA ligase [Candidatus Kerfeldbacteria bacterium]|nr:serine--tRNA ligase [Candidatus Kerfeldbacteria bacterium]
MIDLKLLRADPAGVEKRLRTKRPDVSVQPILEADEKLRDVTTELESLRAEKKRAGKSVPTLKGTERNTLLAQLKELDVKEEKLHDQQSALASRLREAMLTLPNLPADDVRPGADERENEVIRQVGTKPEFTFPAKEYLHLVETHDLADLKRAAKSSGSRFVYLKGALAKLEFALVRYAFDIAEQEGFLPIVPPVLINKRSMEGMGYLAHGAAAEIYHLPKDDLYLVGTAEQSIGPMLQDEVLMKEALPLRFAAFSTCFRREAGSYGKDMKGFLRVHQFDKVELFSFTTPDTSDVEHERFLAIEERLMQALGLHYQVVKMCSGDLGDPAARKYDIETWLPGQGTYRETHSTSTCTDFQARRLNIRYRDGNGMRFVHTVNGTAFAIGRTLIAILENGQTANGDVHVPEALQPYCGFDLISRNDRPSHGG